MNSGDVPPYADSEIVMNPTERPPMTNPSGIDAAASEALRLLAAEDERQFKLHELLETIREQIRLEVQPEHRPEGLFKNIQDAVYAMRGRTRLMDDAAITSVLSTSHGDAPEAYKAWFELREPGRVPERKGPFIGDRAKQFLRELMDARPRAFITVVTVGHDGPDFEDGPECLEIWDGEAKRRPLHL